jgi:signal transduction histidine kinase
MLCIAQRLDAGLEPSVASLLEHLRDAVLLVEPASGCIRFGNPAAAHMFGYAAPDHLRDVSIGELIDDLPLGATDFGPFELCGRTRDGHVLWIEAVLSPLPAGCLVVTVRDVAGRGVAAYQHPAGHALRASQARLQAALARQHFLNQASQELSNSLDYATTLQTMARLPLPRLGDLCVVQVLDDDLRPDGTAVAHTDQRLAAELEACLREELAATSSRRQRPLAPPVLLGTTTRSFEAGPGADAWSAVGLGAHLQTVLRQLDLRALLLVPIVGRGRVLGSMLLGAQAADTFADADTIALAEDLARGCALALDHASLYRTAQQAIAARDQFLSIAAHELRAPLTRIKAHAEMLLLEQHTGAPLDLERLAWSTERINAGVDRLAALTKDVLDIARLRGGQIPFRPRPVDLIELVRDLEPRFAEHLGEGRRLRIELGQTACPVLVDQARIEQILANLLENAAKYSPCGQDVQLSVRPQDDGALLEVRDSGIGLPPGSHEAIFELFGRAANAERLNVPGMGLGLHICRMIVERHGGRIWATSDGEDQGSTFSVWLPFAAASPMPSGDQPDDQAVQEQLTTQLTLAAGYCELLATSPELPEQLRAQAREAMHGAQGAVATLGHLQQLTR